jgi:hypothetical protein
VVIAGAAVAGALGGSGPNSEVVPVPPPGW